MAQNANSFDEAPPVESMSLRGRTWLYMLVALVVVGVGIAYVYQSAKDAMQGAPDSTRSVEQVYVQRCGSCHVAPQAQAFAKWERDWERMAQITMFMGDEREKVHHYLDGLLSK